MPENPDPQHKCDVLLFGTMADIGPTAKAALEGHGLSVVLEDFPQNIFRDFFGYRRELFKAIERHDPRVIIPVGDALALSRLKGELPDGVTACVDCESNISLLGSKVRTYALAESLDIPQPKQYSFDDLSEDTQVIFKRDISFGGSGVHRPRNLASLANLISHENGTPYLIEEYVDGEDLSVDCIRTDGFFKAQCYVSLGRTYTQGPSEERRTTECPEAVKHSRAILDHLDFKGICGFDFRRRPDGRVCLLEANPRLTGGLQTQLSSGFDLPFLLYSLF